MENQEIIDLINKTYDIDPEHQSKIVCDFNLNVLNDVTAIIGGSGTGKTTLIRKFLKVDDVTFNIDSDDCITKLLLDLHDNTDDVFKLLFDVGLSSVPTWKSSFRTLSNGEKLRFEIAYKILLPQNYVFVDEFTSMLDRQTAKNLCYKLDGILKKYKKKFIFASCHYDIMDWIEVDELYDTNLKKSFSPASLKRDQNTNWRSTLRKEIAGEYLATIII